jgi:hypothetical protein
VGCRGGGGSGPHHHQGAGRELLDPIRHQVPEPAAYPIPDDSRTNHLADDESGPGRRRCVVGPQMDHEARRTGPSALPHGVGELGAVTQPPGGRQHRLGRELGASLAATRRQDRPTGTGAHPQAEPMGLRPPTVVRLERALAHGALQNRGRRQARSPWPFLGDGLRYGGRPTGSNPTDHSSLLHSLRQADAPMT